MLLQCQSLPYQAGATAGWEDRGACSKLSEGLVIWGTVFRPAAAASLPGGLVLGQNHTADSQRLEGGKFCKNICSVWMVQIFSEPLT